MAGSIGHFWKNSDRANRRFREKNLSQYYFVQHKSHTGWFGMKSEIEYVRDRRRTL